MCIRDSTQSIGWSLLGPFLNLTSLNFSVSNLGIICPEPLTESFVEVSLNAVEEKQVEKTNIKKTKNILLFFLGIYPINKNYV